MQERNLEQDRNLELRVKPKFAFNKNEPKVYKIYKNLCDQLASFVSPGGRSEYEDPAVLKQSQQKFDELLAELHHSWDLVSPGEAIRALACQLVKEGIQSHLVEQLYRMIAKSSEPEAEEESEPEEELNDDEAKPSLEFSIEKGLLEGYASRGDETGVNETLEKIRNELFSKEEKSSQQESEVLKKLADYQVIAIEEYMLRGFFREASRLIESSDHGFLDWQRSHDHNAAKIYFAARANQVTWVGNFLASFTTNADYDWYKNIAMKGYAEGLHLDGVEAMCEAGGDLACTLEDFICWFNDQNFAIKLLACMSKKLREKFTTLIRDPSSNKPNFPADLRSAIDKAHGLLLSIDEESIQKKREEMLLAAKEANSSNNPKLTYLMEVHELSHDEASAVLNYYETDISPDETELNGAKLAVRAFILGPKVVMDELAQFYSAPSPDGVDEPHFPADKAKAAAKRAADEKSHGSDHSTYFSGNEEVHRVIHATKKIRDEAEALLSTNLNKEQRFELTNSLLLVNKVIEKAGSVKNSVKSLKEDSSADDASADGEAKEALINTETLETKALASALHNLKESAANIKAKFGSDWKEYAGWLCVLSSLVVLALKATSVITLGLVPSLGIGIGLLALGIGFWAVPNKQERFSRKLSELADSIEHPSSSPLSSLSRG